MEEAMLMFPYIANLLAAMLLGALIGAERQWRQRMAGLRTNALVATGAAVLFSSMSTSPDSPGTYCRPDSLRYWFLGAGVIMREGMNVRGLNTAATLWCSAAIGVLCGLGQFWNAAATLIILCANILLREAAQRINQIQALQMKKNAMS
jgi:putative Mg2+ transporter-C (MgtC) family protein